MSDTLVYELPFDYPEDADRKEIVGLAVARNIEIDAQTSWNKWPGEYIVTGTFDDLVEFFQDIDGPAQSFPIDEFREFVAEYNNMEQ